MCSIGTRISANELEIAIHDVGVVVSSRRMMEGPGEAADNFKAEALPKSDGAFIGGDDEIKLHSAKAAFPRAVERMLAHRSGYAAARHGYRRHVTAIGDVSSTALLVCLEAVRSDDVAVIFRNKHLTLGRKPVSEPTIFVYVAGQGIGLASADDGLHDRPDGARARIGCRPNYHDRIMPR